MWHWSRKTFKVLSFCCRVIDAESKQTADKNIKLQTPKKAKVKLHAWHEDRFLSEKVSKLHFRNYQS
jgi:hypothetical protein